MVAASRSKRLSSESSDREEPSASVKRVKLEHVDRRQRMSSEMEESQPGESSRNGRARIQTAEDSDEDMGAYSEDEDMATTIARVAFPDDAENVRAYEAVQEKKKHRYGATSEAGVLMSITVVNFMNHRHTTVDFGAKMNFLVGHNGSGKSAILTAVAVVLGSKAATTGRGSGLKDLIRKGCDKAVITLTMNNSGYDAFKPDIYNPSIIIERAFTINGSSAYKFRASRDGKTLANKRDELTQIIEHFNITIDSPLTILTQDAARNFLQNANDETLYDFFLEGTQLKSLEAMYDTINVQRDTLALNVQQRKEALPEMQARFDRLAGQLRASERVIELQAKLTRTRTEAAWAFVAEKEGVRDKAQVALEELQEKLVVVEGKLEACQNALTPLTEQCEAMKTEFSLFDQTREELETSKRKAKSKYEQAKTLMRANENSLKETVDAIAGREKEIDDLNRKIRAKQQDLDAAEDPIQVELRKNIEKHETLLRNLQREVPVRETSMREKEKLAEQTETETERLRGELMTVDAGILATNTTLRNLERQSTNRLSAFGQNLEPLIADINRAKWRHSKPVGPLGLHVKLEDERYKDLISSHLGQLLCSFAVRCKEDKGLLIKLMDHHYKTKNYRPAYRSMGPPPVIQHTGERFDFSQGDLSAYGETMLSKLRIEDEDVLRILIVQRHIERLFVAPSIMIGNRMIDGLIQSGIPSPVVMCADHFRTSGTLSTSGQPLRDSVTIEKWTGFVLFTRDVATDIREQRRLLDEQNKNRDTCSKQLTAATNAKTQAAQALAEAKRQLQNVRNGIPTAQTKLDRWRNQLEEKGDNDVSTFEKLRKNVQDDMEWYDKQRVTQIRDVADSKETAEKFIQEIKSYDQKMENFMPERTRRRDALEVLLGKRAQEASNLTHWHQASKTSENKVVDAREVLEKIETDLRQWIKSAEGVGARVETTKNGRKLNAEVEQIQKSIRDAEKRGNISREAIMPRYTEAEKKLKEVKETIIQFQRFLVLLDHTLRHRKHWCGEMRGHTALRARTVFIVHLQKRGFNGRLEFNHEFKRLSIKISTTTVRPTQTEDGSATQPRFKAPTNLSGGERSFTTVALLLAMWDTMTCPVRCLDEWDVFLDPVNRGIAARMLIEGARESTGKQFILITPQDMNNVPTGGPDTRIVRMNDPERNQGTLNFQPTA